MRGDKARRCSFALGRGLSAAPSSPDLGKSMPRAISLRGMFSKGRALALGATIPFLFGTASEARADEGRVFGILPNQLLARIDAQEFLIFALIIATLFCTVTGVAALLQTKRALVTSRQEYANKVATLSARLEKAEAMVGAELSVLIAWQDNGTCKVSGDLGRMPGMPGSPDALLDWRNWLSLASAEEISKASKALVERGEACRLLLTTREGEQSFEALGRIVSGRAVLRLRDVSLFAAENAALMEEVRALRLETRLAHTLLDSLPSPVWLRGNDGVLRWANQAFVDMVERSSLEDAIRHDSWLVGSDERANVDKVRDPSGFASMPIRFVTQGTQKLMQVYDLKTAEGKIGLAFDISETDVLRRELNRHIEAHKRTFDQLKSAVAIFDAEQRLVFYNDAYQKLWRLDGAWLDSAPMDGDILDRLRAAHRLPENPDYRNWKDRHLSCYQSNESSRTVWHLPDGQTVSVVTEPHPFGGVIYLFENETETLALQRGFNALEQTQRETLDNLREGVVVFGSNGRVSLFNPAFALMWKLSRKQLEESPHIDDIITLCAPLMDGGNVWTKVKDVVTAMDESRVRIESELVRSDGKVLDYVTVPLPGGATLITFVDVTAARNVANMLREKNEALEAADRIKSNFIQHISYELRAPLTTVIGFTELLADEKSGDLTERQKNYASHILSSSHVLMALIDDILDLASLDAGVVDLQRERIDVEEILNSVFETVQPKLSDLNVRLEKIVAENLQPFYADPQRLRQVLYNLLSNAIAYSNFGQTVRVEAINIGQSVAFKVVDEGSGMSDDVREKVFDRFYSTPSTNTGRGAGLGLSIVKSFVELHGGTVSLSSRKNQGTTVTCMFPASAQAFGQSEDRPAE